MSKELLGRALSLLNKVQEVDGFHTLEEQCFLEYQDLEGQILLTLEKPEADIQPLGYISKKCGDSLKAGGIRGYATTITPHRAFEADFAVYLSPVQPKTDAVNPFASNAQVRGEWNAWAVNYDLNAEQRKERRRIFEAGFRTAEKLHNIGK
jgi:hypothetical protein